MNLKNRWKKLALTAQILFWGLVGFAQNSSGESSIHKVLQQRVDEVFDSLVKVRRDFHVYPELSGQEKRTSKKIETYLLSLGLEVKTNIGGYGVVGILRGDEQGKQIAWRADIDAMPSDIPDVVDFKSKTEGVRHICGHDVHTTIGLGIANVLAGQKENIKGTIYFLFQPAEENYQGARAMIDDGLLDWMKPEEMYALHVTAFPAGFIAIRSKNPFSHTNHVKVSFRASKDNASKIDFTKELIGSFQNVEPDSPFWNLANLGDPELGLSSPKTIYKSYLTIPADFVIKETEDELLISTAVNSSNKEQLDSFLVSLRKKLTESDYADDLISVAYGYKKATVMNDELLTQKTSKIISDIYGASKVIPLYGTVPGDVGDDFAYFQNTIPGVYFLLGGSDFERGVIADPHSPNFAVDEDCIKTGVKFFSSMIVERLNH